LIVRHPHAVALLLLFALPAGAGAQEAASDQTAATPEERALVEVVGATPLAGSAIDRDKVPGTVETLSADDLERSRAPSVLDALSRRVPGVSLNDVQGNDFFQDLRYHGFAASPLQGTAQGIAVYQGGVRINEAFGDTVNWDLIPGNAIAGIDIWTSNPVFGLNALGGAVNIRMKNGFTWQGLEAEIQGGSYGRISGSVQYGVRDGDLSVYVAADGTRDDGWRRHSASDVERFYADGGYQGESLELHLVASGARSSLGVVGPTPIDLIRQDETAIFTSPQATRNEVGMLALNGKAELPGAWAIQGDVYGRHLSQKHVDGNGGNFEACSGKSSFGGRLCLQDDPFGTPAGGKTVAFRNQFLILDQGGDSFPFVSGAPYGTVDRTSTDSTTVGGSAQLTNDAPLFGRGNSLTLGGSVDHGDIGFASGSYLGFIFPDLSVGSSASLPGSGAIIHTLGNLGYAPVGLSATTNYYGVYVVDTYDITQRLAATVGVRVNIAEIDTGDRTGKAAELNGSHSYDHVNPLVGLTYKIGGGVTAYGGYSQSNRAPTPLELDCADPVRPCLLENALVADPPLKQVVSETFEVGLRGKARIGEGGRLGWRVGLFRTRSDDDIVALASAVQGRGYYANVPETLRQGFDGSVQYRSGPLSVYASYSFVDATYRFTGSLASPNNPAADANGNILVRPGDRLPGIPRHEIKVGFDYSITPDWTVGGDVEAFGSQYLAGDNANQNAKLTAYWVANIRTAYQVTEHVELFGGINNLFDRRYATYGTYFETDSVANATSTAFGDPRTLTLAQPISGYGGVKLRF